MKNPRRLLVEALVLLRNERPPHARSVLTLTAEIEEYLYTSAPSEMNSRRFLPCNRKPER